MDFSVVGLHEGGVGRSGGVGLPHGAQSAAKHAPRAVDEVEFSAEARALAGETEPIRHDLVADLRQRISTGTYDTRERLDGALTGLLNDLRA